MKKPTLAVVATIALLSVAAMAQTDSFLRNLTLSGQLTSTVATGTAPFVVASTTNVANLNASTLNGKTAPVGNIVGDTDTQTLSGKTLTSPTINSPTLDGTGAGHAASQASAARNFGASLTTQTIISSLPATGNVVVSLQPVQSLAGVGCGAGTNTVSWTLNYTGPGGTASFLTKNNNLSISANGSVDTNSAVDFASATNSGVLLVAQAGTSITYTTSSSLASAGCTTTPQYTVYAKAFF